MKNFPILSRQLNLTRRYNVAPSQLIPVVRSWDDIELMKWGLVPSWAKDISIGNKMINARAETVAEKPAFRSSFKKRRCVVLADGFFEWKKVGEKKQPYYIRLKDRSPFGFACLWDRWKSPEGEVLESFSIITTEANEIVRPIHDRMPVIFDRPSIDAWLTSGEISNVGLLKPFPSEAMEADPVSTIVNRPQNDSPDCIEKVKPESD